MGLVGRSFEKLGDQVGAGLTRNPLSLLTRIEINPHPAVFLVQLIEPLAHSDAFLLLLVLELCSCGLKFPTLLSLEQASLGF